MGSFFRSEEMSLCQMLLQSESAYACVSELGELGLVQFRDLNPDVNAFQRKFVNEIRRCDEMERKLRYLEKELNKDGIPIAECTSIPEAPQPRDMIDLEATFEKLENELREVNQNAEALKRNYLELSELKHVLKKTQIFFDENDGGIQNSESMTKALISDEPVDSNQPNMGQAQLGFVAGVILRERIPAFERMLWRACRGNVFLRQTEIEVPLEDPSTGENVYKSVFIIFFQGDQLKIRVRKICEGFRATTYPCPEAPIDRRKMAMGVVTRIEDLNTVLGQTQDHRHRVLVAAAKNVKTWSIKVRKIKAIYHTLNLFNLDVTQKCLIAECWIPVLDIDSIQLALRRGTEQSGSSIAPILNRMSTNETPPTFNRTNKFTSAFQELVNAYGVSSYREINPAQYTIITFPFLFGVMFGDIGHGAIMFLVACWMIYNEKRFMAMKSGSEITQMIFGGRYIIFLMGAFSVYAGFIYNDIFSKSLNIFGTTWRSNFSNFDLINNATLQLSPIAERGFVGKPYPFGFDPIWQLADNKIMFTNSFKMKFSIVIGTFHMFFGIMLSYVNMRFFRSKIKVLTTFIPQTIFFLLLFMYLSLMIFIKWFKYSSVDELDPATSDESFKSGAQCAPSILVMFINMFLFQENRRNAPRCDEYMYAGQDQLQRFSVVFALLCIPFVFVAKPLYNYMKLKEQKPYAPGTAEENGQMVNGASTQIAMEEESAVVAAPAGDASVESAEDNSFGELFIVNGIHAIEFFLGTISHTASYLRLWALSLAHAQLSDVLWKMVLKKGLEMESWVGGFALYITFMFWSTLTVCILVLMEGLSAFLHTLRLHWVEFQSKFYEGTGYIFEPFSFEAIIGSKVTELSDD